MDLRDAVESAPPPVTKDEHLSVRSIVLGVGVIIVIALILILIVEGRRPVDTDGTQGTWGGTGGVEFWGGVARQEEGQRMSVQDLLAQQRKDGYVHIQTSDPLSQTETPLDLIGLLGQLTEPSQTDTTDAPMSAYDFIPRGLISGTAPTTKQTDLQQELYRYGNDLGGFLRTFEDSHTNILTILKDAREDLGNTQKADAAAQIGTDYRILARDLKEMARVPASAKTLHQSFADANDSVGRHMEAVARAKNDQEFLEAVDAYNKSVEAYGETFVALASLFAAAQVTFAEGDQGSVFSFRGTISAY